MRLTTPAPIQAPTVALTTMASNSSGSTVIAVTKKIVSGMPAATPPTVSVPGMSSSFGRPRNLYSAVVVA